MSNQGSEVAQKQNEKSPGNKLKHMKICGISDREFKIAVLKILSEMRENTDRQFNAFRKQIKKQNLYKEIETLLNN